MFSTSSRGGKLQVIGSWVTNSDAHSPQFLALKWVVCKNFRDNLFYSPHFTIYTDNNPLPYIMSTAKLSGRIVRLSYRPGRFNTNTDTLSRIPLDILIYYISMYTKELSQDVVNATWQGRQVAQKKDVVWMAALFASSLDITPQPHPPLQEINHELVQAKREDPTISDIIILKQMNDKLTDETRRSVKGTACELLHECEWLHFEDGILY